MTLGSPTILLLVLLVLAVAGVLLWLRWRLKSRRAAQAGPLPGDATSVERGIDFPAQEPREEDTEAFQPAPEPVEFTVYHPPELVPERWAKLLAYAHLAGARDEVERDREKVLAGEPGAHRQRSADAIVPIRRESAIRVVPQLPGCRFNPAEASFLWLEDWHSALFRVQAHRQAPGFAPGQAVNGRVAFYVESVLVGEVPIWALISDRAELEPGEPRRSAPVAAFDRVFASYSHRDGEIVEALGRAYEALGMEFLRDVEVLRSGEEWNPRLLELIEGADVFQLYWSENARASPYVAQEWRHALAQQRERFIRPVYWQRPMPPPPEDLRSIHFAYLSGLDRG